MRLKTVSISAATLIGATAIIASPAQAVSFDNPVAVEIACTSFVYTFDGFAFDRNNQGDQSPFDAEKATFRATDGLGNLLYTNTVVQRLIDSDVPGVDDVSVFTVTPVANPITFTVTSEAGNGLPEEESLRLFSTCLTIPSPATVTPADFTLDIEEELIDTLAPFASETNGFPLTFTLLTPPASGALTLNLDGTFTYAPGTVGDHSFVATVANEVGQSVELPVTITDTGGSVPPVVVPPEIPAPTTSSERNQLAVTGAESLTGLAGTGIAAGILGLALMRLRRKV